MCIRDSLTLTQGFGTFVHDPQSPEAFGREMVSEPYDQVLIATGDGSKWMVMDPAEIQILVENGSKQIVASHLNQEPHAHLMYNRANAAEDPWLSYGDHSDATTILYGENSVTVHAEHTLQQLGINVFVRMVAPAVDSALHPLTITTLSLIHI